MGVLDLIHQLVVRFKRLLIFLHFLLVGIQCPFFSCLWAGLQQVVRISVASPVNLTLVEAEQ